MVLCIGHFCLTVNDAWNDVFGVHNLSSSVMLALAKLGHTCPSDGAQLPVFHVDDVMASLEQSFCDVPASADPRTAGSSFCRHYELQLP